MIGGDWWVGREAPVADLIADPDASSGAPCPWCTRFRGRWVERVESRYGVGLIEPPPLGGSAFATNRYPETWWWANFGADVLAITLETVYGRAGFAPDWITRADLRDLGVAVVLALVDYHGLGLNKSHVPRRFALPPSRDTLLYPSLYPPAAVDELKE